MRALTEYSFNNYSELIKEEKRLNVIKKQSAKR